MQKIENKKLVWILLPNLNVGGAEIFLTSLASELSAQFHIVFLVNNNNSNLLIPSATVYTHKNSTQFIYRMVRLAWQQPPDIILSSIIDINLISLLTKSIMPRHIKHIIREALPLREACNLTKAPRLYLWLARRLYPKADAIVSLSAQLFQGLNETVPTLTKHTKEVVIPNGVGNNRVLANPSQHFTAGKVVAIGRLEHQKGFDELIKAFGRFATEKPSYQLKLIGDGSQRKHLEDLISQSARPDSIELCGSLKNPIKELSSAAFFVLPSRYEGLSNAMLEALVNGVPVLATVQLTSAKDIITDDNGILIDYCEEEKILEGLCRMHENLNNFDRKSIAISSRKKFSIKAAAEEYAKLMIELLNNEKLEEPL